MKETTPNVLYRLFDAEGALLYIGITVDFQTRMRYHRRQKPWWGEVARTETEPFRSRSEALTAEWYAIVNECPKYNVEHADERSRSLNAVLAERGQTREEAVAEMREQGMTWKAVGEALGISRDAAYMTGGKIGIR